MHYKDHFLFTKADRLAATLPPLVVQAQKYADILWHGVHSRRRSGSGHSFWQYRPYSTGDMPRHIDWRKSARGDHVLVRQEEWETSHPVCLWSDHNPGMGYHSHPDLPTKAHSADIITLCLTSLLLRGGETVQLGDHKLHNKAHYTDLYHHTDFLQLSPPNPRRLPRNSTLIYCSDFLQKISLTRQQLTPYTTKADRLLLIQILDPAEDTFPFKGRTHFYDLQDADDVLIGDAESVREAYLKRFHKHQARLKDLVHSWARHSDCRLLTYRTDQPLLPFLLSLYQILHAAEHTGRRHR